MWMSQLAAEAGLPVPTVKYYLREGLLHPGQATGATRARYDAGHVRRLRLVRALTDVAGLSLDAVRAVLEAVDDPARSWHEAIGSAHGRIGAEPTDGASAASLERVDAFIARRGWQLGEGNVDRVRLARTIDTLESVGHAPSEDLLDTYAQAAEAIATAEVGAVSATDRVAAAEHVVIGTLLLEPALLSIRRMAQEAESHRTRR